MSQVRGLDGTMQYIEEPSHNFTRVIAKAVEENYASCARISI
jgi:hypothetical protein